MLQAGLAPEEPGRPELYTSYKSYKSYMSYMSYRSYKAYNQPINNEAASDADGFPIKSG